MQVLGDKILKSVPRFQGPQSDKDVASYTAAAGRLKDPTIPVEQRISAFQTIIDINKKYAPNLDWSFGQAQTGQTSSGNKFRKVQ